MKLRLSRLCPATLRGRRRLLTSWCALTLLVVLMRLLVLRMSDPPRLPVAAGNSQSTPAARCARRPRRVLAPARDRWWAFYGDEGRSDVFVFSAFLDARLANPRPVLRLLAVSSPGEGPAYCQFWYEDAEAPLVANLSMTRNGRGHRVGGVHYNQLYFSCVPPRPHPVLVSVTSRPCDAPQTLVPVTYPRRGLSHQFVVCVPITFGKVDVQQVVEWVEAHRVLGVTEIHVYYVHMNEEALRPFRFYEDLGIVRLHSIPTVPRWENSYNGNKLSSMVVLNDCLYRNMYRAKWIIPIDYDEIIMPTSIRTRNYTMLIDTIDKSLDRKKYANVSSYTFRNAYYWLNCGRPKFDEPRGSRMMRYVRREPISRYMFGAKTILSPLTCVSLFNHYCYHPFHVRGRPVTIDVSSVIATSHHYRQPRIKKVNCRALSINGTDDLSLLHIKPQLEKRYQAVIRDMRL